MKQSVLLALIGASSAVKLGDWYDKDASQDDLAGDEKHNYFTDVNGKTFDLAQHGKFVDQNYLQQEDNFDNGFEEIDITPGQHKKSHYFVAQTGKTYDLSSGHRVELRNENFIRGEDEMVQLGDYYDRNLPEDAFQEAPAAPIKMAEAKKTTSFTYDRVTGLPMIAGLESDAEGQLNFDSMVQLGKEAPKKASGFSYNPVTGLPNVIGDEIDYDHDFVQFQGEPIGQALKSRNLLQVGDDWMADQADFFVTENIPRPAEKPHQKVRYEGYNAVVTI